MITRALLLLGTEMLASALLLAALSDWRVTSWSEAMSNVTGLRVKGTALFGVPALYFAFVASNAFERATRASSHGFAWVAAVACTLSAGSAVLFWALPLWLTA